MLVDQSKARARGVTRQAIAQLRNLLALPVMYAAFYRVQRDAGGAG